MLFNKAANDKFLTLVTEYDIKIDIGVVCKIKTKY